MTVIDNLHYDVLFFCQQPEVNASDMATSRHSVNILEFSHINHVCGGLHSC